MDQRPTQNASQERRAPSTETFSATAPYGRASEPTSKNAAESVPMLRWLGETHDQEYWNTVAILKEILMRKASKM
jgi:hypothetical protein